jgi:hypothetical protein
LAKLAALDVLPADEAVGRDEEEHQRNIRYSYGLYLNPKVGRAEVEQFESRYGIRLPDDYRSFLIDIGNGGFGPGDGGVLYSLQRSVGAGRPAEYLGRPFPLDQSPAGTEHRWRPPADEEVCRRHRNGLLLLSHRGCGTLTCLVVCGLRYGEVWVDDFANGGLIFPAQDSWVGPPGRGRWRRERRLRWRAGAGRAGRRGAGRPAGRALAAQRPSRLGD